MLPKAIEHFLQEPCYQRGGSQKDLIATGEYCELLTIIKKRKLSCFDHVPRSSALAQTIPQHTVNGKRRRDIERRRGAKTTSKSSQGWTLPAQLG